MKFDLCYLVLWVIWFSHKILGWRWRRERSHLIALTFLHFIVRFWIANIQNRKAHRNKSISRLSEMINFCVTVFATLLANKYSSNLLGLSLAITYVRFLVFNPLSFHFHFLVI